MDGSEKNQSHQGTKFGMKNDFILI